MRDRASVCIHTHSYSVRNSQDSPMSTRSRSTQSQRVARLRNLLAHDLVTVMPCCYDGLSAKLIERAGFEVTFMTGFGVSAVHGLPDTQLVSFGEMSRTAGIICESLRDIPCIGDADTGYGNAVNVKRTVAAYAQAGMAGILLEDQVSPKRCGHTAGKAVVSRDEAFARVRAAVDARREGQFDLVILARTDARGTHSLDEAIARCKEFVTLGADITFLEAPQSIEEMETYCREVPGPKMANMVENGLTPVLLPEQLGKMGYTLVAYPITLLSASISAMEKALKLLKCQTGEKKEEGSAENATPCAALDQLLCDFGHVKDVVGFTEYYAEEERYKA
uniref:Carboxyvinyl-carboxyphosphonate phosphorylmutase n=1 Tax=Peronospora matthiolae TaxID=2874970 RepID=A0AAV1TB74_9STRA